MTTCTCPKCKAEIDIDATLIPAEGSFNKCPACSASLVFRKESFARRALYTSAEISCAECGNPPGVSTYCESCHAIYPEILVIETTSAVKKLIASFSAPKSSKAPGKTARELSTQPAASSKDTATARGPSKSVLRVIILVLILATSAGGGFFWYQNKIETQYSQKYVKAILAIKTARDVEVRTSKRVAASWQAGTGSALTEDEQKATASAKKDVDTLVNLMEKAPEKFIKSHDAIKKLHDSFNKLHASVTAPSGTFEIYTATVTKNDEEFIKIARQLQSGLPEKISAIYSVSKKKYKALQDF